MLTLLNKLFNEDISLLIYKYYLTLYIDKCVINKLHNSGLLMENIIREYYNCLNKDLYILNHSKIKNIYNNLTYIHNHFIVYDCYSFSFEYKFLIYDFIVAFNEIIYYETHVLFKSYYKTIVNNLNKIIKYN